MTPRPLLAFMLLAGGLAAQDQPAAPVQATEEKAPVAATDGYTIKPGTKIPLSMINSISTKSSQIGDQIYLETAFPIVVNGKIVVPAGSWVQGSVTDVKRPGRVKGRGELYIRFDTLLLPNGVTRELRSRMSGMDSNSTATLDRDEGKIKSESGVKDDLKTVGQAAGAGAGLGGLAGSISGHPYKGIGIGGAAGAAAGVIYTLISRGPDAEVPKGATVEMVLDRTIELKPMELDFSNANPRPIIRGVMPSSGK